MIIKDRLNNWLSEEMRAYIVAMMAAYFSLVYHIFAFILFYHLNVTFMMHFNVASIICFAILSAVITFKKKIVVPYLLGLTETLFHQLLALYFLGAESSFQYLILIVGLIPFLIMGHKFKLAFTTGLLSTILFIVISVYNRSLFPHVEIDHDWIFIIRTINITCSVIVIFILVLIFCINSNLTEQKLSSQVMMQASALQSQNTKIIEIQNNTILSLSNLVENRDSDTGHHILRTREYVRVLAEKAKETKAFRKQLPASYIDLMIKSAPMHDIGKIVVPDSILKKPGKLTDEEFKEIMRHTTEGGKIIQDVIGHSGDKEYVKVATEIATSHHEKWDGTGYPYKLKGTQIPLSARIMALADVFDALVSPRCYKKPFTVTEAIKIIEESAGSHFDPDLARIFVKHRDLLEEISILYKD